MKTSILGITCSINVVNLGSKNTNFTLPQWILSCPSFPFAFIMGYVYFTPVLMLYVPDHRCANASVTVGQCQMYSEEEGSLGELVDCQYGYEYDIDDLFETAITDVS